VRRVSPHEDHGRKAGGKGVPPQTGRSQGAAGLRDRHHRWRGYMPTMSRGFDWCGVVQTPHWQPHCWVGG
jgi:hypothetical protein